MAKYLLGIDNGNTNCKATLFDECGQMVYSTSSKIEVHSPQKGWTERNIGELWEANIRNIRYLIRESCINPKEIIGVGNTGHGNGLYLLDKFGKPVLGIQSLDTRAGNLVQCWKSSGLDEEVYRCTHQEFWASQSNSLLAWLKQNNIDLYKNIGAVLLCKDLINYFFTGVVATDFSDISATNLLNIHTRNYDSQLLKFFQIEEIRNSLPPIFESQSIIGGISKIASKQTGVPEGTPVIAGMLDVNANIIGSGIMSSGQAGVIAGTWSVNALVSSVPPTDPRLAMTALFAISPLYLTIEASATSMANLDWFVNQFCESEKRLANKAGVSVYQLCDEIVENIPISPDLIYHPFLYGSNELASARAGFYGLSSSHTKSDMLRAIYEGIVFGHLSHVEKLRNSGADFAKVRLTGGGARSLLLSQMFADIFNVEIEVPAAKETGTWGVAMAVGIATKVFKSYEAAIEETVVVENYFYPTPSNNAIYQEKYSLYRSLIKQIRPIWTKLGKSQ